MRTTTQCDHCETETIRMNDECEEAFNLLKSKLSSPPILAYPDPCGSEFILDTDCSNKALGTVLSQIQNGQERMLAYYSRALTKSEGNYCTTTKELLAVISIFIVIYMVEHLLFAQIIVH